MVAKKNHVVVSSTHLRLKIGGGDGPYRMSHYLFLVELMCA